MPLSPLHSMGHCFDVQDWMMWSADGGPHILYQHLPEEILKHPVDTRAMTHRIKTFAATVVLHQVFVDLKPQAAERDRFRSMLDHVRDGFEIPSEVMDDLRSLRHLCDEARHHFLPHARGIFGALAGDWLPDPEVDALNYGPNMLRVRRRTVVEIIHDPEEDFDWVKAKVYHMQNFFAAGDMVGWIPRQWLLEVPCWINDWKWSECWQRLLRPIDPDFYDPSTVEVQHVALPE